MKIHLIHTNDVDPHFVKEVITVLAYVPGPLNFLSGKTAMDAETLKPVTRKVRHEKFTKISYCLEVSANELMMSDSFPAETKEVTWEKLFDTCETYRRKFDTGRDEFVLLLTGLSNEKNWFSAIDTNNRNNVFIQSTFWEYFISGERQFPVAYEVASLVLRRLMFDDYPALNNALHKEPRGCVNDITKDKRNVTFKMRTGDICENCQHIIRDRKIDIMLVQQVFGILNRIRGQMMYLQQLKENLAPGKMVILTNTHEISFPDYGDVKVNLTPLEMTTYLLLVNHSEGISFNEFPDFEAELLELYKGLATHADLAGITNSAHNLAWNTDNSLSQKLSNINRKISQTLGGEIAQFYKIKGAPNEKRHIGLDRRLVRISQE